MPNPTWREVIESERWQKLPLTQKLLGKRGYFNQVIKTSDKFTSLPPEQRQRIEQDFFSFREEEGLPDTSQATSILGAFAKQPAANRAVISGIKKGDVAVENVAQAVSPLEPTPTIPAGRTKLGLLTKDLPRQVAADVLRAYKPSTYLTFETLAGLLKPVGGAIGRKVVQKAPAPLKRFATRHFTVGKGLPQEYLQAAKTAQLERFAGAREAEDAANVLTRKFFTNKMLSPKEQRIVGRIFRGEAEKIRYYPKYQEYSAIARQGRSIMDKWSNELVKSGIPKGEVEETIKNNVGKYMARMFKSKLEKQPAGFGSKELRLRLNGLKHRKDLSSQVLREMGEIKEPALPTAIRVKEVSTSIANNRLFNTVAQNPEWVANVNVGGNLVKMADTPNLGALKGKWVVPEIAEEINAITAIKQNNVALEAYSKALSAWKYSKVVLNPATHARNMISNSMLLDLSGVNHLRQAQLMPKVMNDYLRKGENYQLALRYGAIGGEWFGGEIKILKNSYLGSKGGNLNRLLNALKVPFRKAGNIYQAEEQLSKMIKFTDVLAKGGTPEVAAREAQKWLFNYNEIPNAIKVAKQIAPFITFTYKSLPRVGEALVNNPLKVYKYYALFNGWNEASRKFLGMSPVEYAREKKALPPWLLRSIGGLPSNLLMPYRDKYNRTQWLNLEYILPLGMAPEILQRGILRGGVSNPLLNIWADLSKNSDFKGSEIVPAGSTRLEAIQKITEYVYRQLAPSLAPGLPGLKGGYSFEKLMSAIKQQPDYADRVRGITPVLFDILAGLKVTPLDVDESEEFRYREKQRLLDELRSQAYRLENQPIPDDVKDREIEKIFIKMDRIIDEE